MSASPDSFADWACDSRRSLEERYGAELLIEAVDGLWKQKHGIKQQVNYEAERLRRKARALDPAYQPDYTREDAMRAEEVLPEMKQLRLWSGDDRPLRDLSFLRFCPPLETLDTPYFFEIRDWSPLRFQPALTSLYLRDRVVRDLRILGSLAKLETLHLFLGAPWPDLTGLEKLENLHTLNFYGNILALRDIPKLPRLRDLEIHHGGGYNIPLRNLGDLPEMPELRRLYLENTAELDGIGRCKKLLNLHVFGYFTDLAPLAELTELTHLTISGGDYPTLAPLATLPQLRRLTVCHEVPPDFLPLADAPRLHEAVMEISHIVPAELPALNAMFAPWSEEFALPQPRPLAPLKLVLRQNGLPDIANDGDAAPRDWGDDQEMGKSEARWFVRETNRRLNRLLGEGWGELTEHALNPGHDMLTITRPEDIDRLPEIVQCLRELIAAARHPWQLMFIVDSLARFERDIGEIYRDDGEEFDAERQREEWEYQQRQKREHREFLERKYRHQVQQELGTPALPENSTPENQSREADADTLESTIGSAAPEYDLGTRLYFFSTLTEKAVYLYHEDEVGLAKMLLNIQTES
jgi:hypothetical protein